jgi:hypothetical protein
MLNFLSIHRHHPSCALRENLCSLMDTAVKPPAVINLKTQVVILILYRELIYTLLGKQKPSLRALARCVCWLLLALAHAQAAPESGRGNGGQRQVTGSRKGGEAPRRPRLGQGGVEVVVTAEEA